MANLNPLLEFIRKKEARGDYNAVWSGIAKQHRPTKPLTSMTVQAVLDWQDSIDKFYRSEAAGAYQILEDTLRDLVKAGAVKATAKFDAATQDELAITLMRGRGLDLYLSKKMTAVAFANALAKEWASLPVVSGPKRGQSYYAGDGLNKSLATADEFLRVMEAVLIEPQKPVVLPMSKPKATAVNAISAAIIAAGAALFLAVKDLLPSWW